MHWGRRRLPRCCRAARAGGGGDGGAGAPLDALEELNASHNPLGPVLSPPPAAAAAADAGGTGLPLPALRVLRLEGCNLEAITGGVVGGLAPSLTELHLGGNAALAALPPDVTALGRLRVLAAAGCALTALPADLFRSLPALTVVRLGGNAGLTMAALTGMDGYDAYEARRVGGVDKALGGGSLGVGGGLRSRLTADPRGGGRGGEGREAGTHVPVAAVDGDRPG